MRATRPYLSGIPGFQRPRAGAHTLENHKQSRQPKPNPRGQRRPLRVPENLHTALEPSHFPRDSGWPTNSSALPKHTRDSDWRYFQSNCNPGTDKHYSEGNVGASGTNQHRPIFLKRWKACLSPGVLGNLQGQPLPACTDERMPQHRPKMLST